jgi:hypothetical protein
MSGTTSSPDLNTFKYTTLFHHIHNMNMRDVRDVYKGMRQSGDNDANMFFPRLGFTAGEFAVAHVMKMPRRTRS